MFATAFFRSRYSHRDFADRYLSEESNARRNVIKTVGQDGTRCFGRPFVTSGWTVLIVSLIVLAVEAGLLVLLIRLCEYNTFSSVINDVAI